MMRFVLLVCCFIICKICLQAQNLVPNPSFEDSRGKRPSMSPWQMINTIDYFIYDESKKDQAIKSKIKDKNFKLRPARTGKAYVGLRVWPRYSEYLVVELLQPLEADKQYYFEMYICLSNHSNAYLRSIGASFYTFKPPYSQKSGIFDFPPHITIYKHYGLIDTTDWFKVAGVFTAEGGERFMTIGNFSRNNTEKFKRRRFGFGKREAYYYIDDVALYKLDDFGFPLYEAPSSDTLKSVAYKHENSNQNKGTFDVEHYYKIIGFPSGSFELTYESYQKLAYVVNYLLSNPLVQIYIIGYAGTNDNSVDDEMVKLAQRRARNVSNFISGNKINKSRIHVNYSVSNCQDPNKSDQQIVIPCNSVEILFSNDTEDMKRVNSPFFNLMP